MDGQLLGDAATSPITLGIFFGFVLGEPISMITASWLGSRVTGIAPSLSWPVIVDVAGVARWVHSSSSSPTSPSTGSSFEEAKLGVLAAAIGAALLAHVQAHHYSCRRPCARARSAGTAGAARPVGRRRSRAEPHPRSGEGAGHAGRVRRLPSVRTAGRRGGGRARAVQSFGDDLRYVAAPRSPTCTRTRGAAEAAEAAAAQGAFWPMHDRMLGDQSRLTFPDLQAHAAELGLDVSGSRASSSGASTSRACGRGRGERGREWRGRHADLLHQRATSPGHMAWRPYTKPCGVGSCAGADRASVTGGVSTVASTLLTEAHGGQETG